MEDFSTLHDFLSFTKGLTYLLMGVMLIVLGGLWAFLTSRDEE
ncbi:MAG: hmc operon protein 4 [Desulfovermiculus sp.]|nr:hmc operon protein 4 [Desulfovermiculus sp.]